MQPTLRRGGSLNGDLLVIAGVAIFGGYALFLRLLPVIPTALFLLAFQEVGGVAMRCMIRDASVTRVRAHLPLLGALAVAGLATDLSYFAAFRTTSVANAAVAAQSVSLFLLVLAPVLVHQRTERREWHALVIAMAGFAVLYSRGLRVGNTRDLLGLTLGVSAGFWYALLIILYGVLPARGLPLRVVNFWRYAISTLILLPFLPLLGVGSMRAGDIPPLVAFGVLFAVIATAVHTLGISRTRPLHASILGKMEPVFATAYAFLVLGEAPAIETVVGGALIFGSSAWLALREPAPPPSMPQ